MSDSMTSKPQTINNFDFIDLLGLSSLEENEKNSLRDEMHEMILTDFFLHELDDVLTADEKKQVEVMFEQDKDFNEIVTFISSKIPNFSIELVKFLADAKKKLVAKQYETRINQLQEDLKDNDNSILQDKISQYHKAKSLLKEERYQEICALFGRRDTSVLDS